MHFKSLLTPALLPLMLVALPIASLGNSAVSESVISPASSRVLLRNKQKGKKKVRSSSSTKNGKNKSQKGKKKARSSSTAKNGKNKRRRSTPTTDKAKKRRSSPQSKVEKEAGKDVMRRKIEAEKEAKRRKSYWKSTASYIGKALRRVDKAEANVMKSVSRSRVFKKNMLTCAERDILENTPVSDLACAIEQIARCRFNLTNLTSLTNRRWKQGTNCSSECPAPPSDGSWAMMGEPIVGTSLEMGYIGAPVLSGDGRTMVVELSYNNTDIAVYELNKNGKWSMVQIIETNSEVVGKDLVISNDGSRLVAGPFGKIEKNTYPPVQIFARDSKSGKYNPLGKPLTGEDKDAKLSGVAISADGGTVAVRGTNIKTNVDFVRTWRWNRKAKDWDMIGDRKGDSTQISLNNDGNRIVIGNSKGGGQ